MGRAGGAGAGTPVDGLLTREHAASSLHVEAAPGRRPYLTAAALMVAGVSYALQQTMVLPALPTLQSAFHTTTAWTTWVFTAFLVSSTVATPLLGKLGDQHGKNRLLVVSLAVFFLGCVGAAAAWNVWSLIAFRALQGAGGAVFPLGFAIIHDEFPRDRLGVGIGALSSVIAIGGGFGLVFAGLILANLSWRFLFVLGSLPVALAAVLVHRVVPESPIKTHTRLDVVGGLLLSGGLVAFLLALTEGSSWGWGSAAVLGLFGAAAAAIALWVPYELRFSEPMVDVHMLVDRPVLFTNLTALFAGVAVFAPAILVMSFMQVPRGLTGGVAQLVHYGFGVSPTRAGLVLLPGSLLGLFSGLLAAVLGQRHGSKWPLALGMAFSAAALGALALAHAHEWEVTAAMTLIGFGVPLAYAAMAKLIVDAVRPSETGVASGMNTIIRSIGGVVGAQVVAAVLSSTPIVGTDVPAELGYVIGFWITAAAGALAVVFALFVTPRRST